MKIFYRGHVAPARHDRASLRAIKSAPHSNFEQTLEFFAQTSAVQDRFISSRTGTVTCALNGIFILRLNHVERAANVRSLDSQNQKRNAVIIILTSRKELSRHKLRVTT